jgi:hypothetical protein
MNLLPEQYEGLPCVSISLNTRFQIVDQSSATAIYHFARFREAQFFFAARDIFRRVAADSLYPPRLRPRPGPMPLSAVIAARTRSRRCSSFVASFFKAFRICIARPASDGEDTTQCGVTERQTSEDKRSP